MSGGADPGCHTDLRGFLFEFDLVSLSQHRALHRGDLVATDAQRVVVDELPDKRRDRQNLKRGATFSYTTAARERKW